MVLSEIFMINNIFHVQSSLIVRILNFSRKIEIHEKLDSNDFTWRKLNIYLAFLCIEDVQKKMEYRIKPEQEVVTLVLLAIKV